MSLTADTDFAPLSGDQIQARTDPRRFGRDTVSMARDIQRLRAKVATLELAIKKRDDDMIAAARVEVQLLGKILTGEAATR